MRKFRGHELLKLRWSSPHGPTFLNCQLGVQGEQDGLVLSHDKVHARDALQNIGVDVADAYDAIPGSDQGFKMV